MLTTCKLAERTTGAIVADSLEVADGFWSRLVGWQFRKSLPPGRGLLIVPCPSVHTFCVRFAIDVVMLDRQGIIVEIRRNVRPWRVVLPKQKIYAILELPAGAAKVAVGTRLCVTSADATLLPQSLQFLSSREIDD